MIKNSGEFLIKQFCWCRTARQVSVLDGSLRVGACKNNNMVKREKGLWWMPWRIKAKKAVVSCEKSGGGAHIH